MGDACDKATFTRLNSKADFVSWERTVLQLLYRNNHGTLMKSQAPEPTQDIEETKASFRQRKETWETNHMAAKAMLETTLGDTAYQAVKGIINVKEAFDKLVETFGGTEDANFLLDVREFTRCTQSSCGGTVAEFAAELERRWNKMNGCKSKPDEGFLIGMFVNGLDEPLQQSFSLGIESRHKISVRVDAKPTDPPSVRFPVLVSEAQAWENRLKLGNENQSFFSGRDHKRKRCQHCSKGGHESSGCWKKFPDKKPQWAIGREAAYKQQRINQLSATDGRTFEGQQSA
ncbi:uncharacterized protein K489DRAFT_414378 [Dissoconium aciculare CBS 342.82]|uniref:Uncharacterized protein n=1 Tax=Dissoconium aciculare CBS 342.82 TaxID=1314786 RepID=A0A6J3LSV1_9PEZI|nr:uncharacterized protein K489DRAFT_414380 [Dissoconium aciculare CBS 342.82]XP_033454728.1 uncharacterized protein K489DRAFT_414378 [Dissoconium aciculare CBS 342.82]KAF1817691.1 hypothetical protein K489DRAFT_414380 [Dissoconium aciculare CBS 342.82]KAF1817692.1 hypothetical protein K489DRAFT_414378 [Dissoconium aciculare CBS 342.82]